MKFIELTAIKNDNEKKNYVNIEEIQTIYQNSDGTTEIEIRNNDKDFFKYNYNCIDCKESPKEIINLIKNYQKNIKAEKMLAGDCMINWIDCLIKTPKEDEPILIIFKFWIDKVKTATGSYNYSYSEKKHGYFIDSYAVDKNGFLIETRKICIRDPLFWCYLDLLNIKKNKENGND
jgi:hypothetical protein